MVQQPLAAILRPMIHRWITPEIPLFFIPFRGEEISYNTYFL